MKTDNFFISALKQIFQRPKNNIPALDGVRAFFILFITVFHVFFFLQYVFAERPQYLEFIRSTPTFFWWIWRSDFSADVLFFLSAFLTTQILLSEQLKNGYLDIKNFYFKRLIRIYPLYCFAILIYVIGKGNNWQYFWANLLMVNNFMPSDKIFIPWTWTLTIEGQFYLLVPWLIPLLNRSKTWFYFMLCIVGVNLWHNYSALIEFPILYKKTAIDLFLTKDEATAILYANQFYVPLIARMAPLAIGVYFGHLFVRYSEQFKTWATKNLWQQRFLFLCSWLALLWGLTYYHNYIPSTDTLFNETNHFIHYIFDRTVFTFAFAFILVSTLLNIDIAKYLNRFLSIKFWVPIAQISYSLFMFHPPFLFISIYLVSGSGQKLTSANFYTVLAAWGIGMALCFLFSILTYTFIERPFLQWGTKFRK